MQKIFLIFLLILVAFNQNCPHGSFEATNGQCTFRQECLPFSCIECSPNGCAACSQGNIVQNSQCIERIPNCNNQDGNFCFGCEPGYSLQNGACRRTAAQIENCRIQDANICQQCQTGYLLSDNICFLRVENCLEQGANTCFQCISGYQLINGFCFLRAFNPIPNCRVQEEETCFECETGYILFQNSCFRRIDNCLQQSGSTCIECEQEFFPRNEICFLIIEHCIDQSPTSCFLCEPGYDLINGVCVIAQIPNCNVQERQICVQCRQGFVASQDLRSCNERIPNCLFQNLGICFQCQPGFFVNQQRRCSPFQIPFCVIQQENICLECELGFFIDFRGICQRFVLPNCFRADRDICLQCNIGYTLNFQQQCERLPIRNCLRQQDEICLQCILGYTPDERGQCIVMVPNCVRQNNQNCLQCDQGYQLTSDWKCEESLSPDNLDHDGENPEQDTLENDWIRITDPPRVRDGFIPCNFNRCGESEPLTQEQYLDLLNSARVRKQQQVDEANRRNGGGRFLQAFSNNNNFNINLNHQRDFSGTNNQDVNVDEADILKNDDTYIYTVSRQFLHIILAYPINNFQVIQTYNLNQLEGAHPVQILIDGDKLALFAVGRFLGERVTVVLVYNTQNKGNVVLEKKYVFHGLYVDGRKNNITGYVQFLTKGEQQDEFPWYSTNPSVQTFLERDTIFKWRYYPTNRIFLNIISFSLRQSRTSRFKMISMYSQDPNYIYISFRNLYFTYTYSSTNTRIHKIQIWQLRIVPTRDRQFSGIVNNQFALDEYQGTILRVAAIRERNGQKSISIYAYDSYLRRYGTRNNIVRGHEITSARYLNKRLYIGTNQGYFFFAEFTPTHIRPLVYKGINFNGAARYTHFLNINEILVFGKQLNTEQLNVWIVRNNRNFLRQNGNTSINIPGSSSSLEVQHQPFLIYPNHRIVVFPLKAPASRVNGAMALTFNTDNSGRYEAKWNFFNHVGGGTPFNDSDVERSLFINEYVYTKSKCRIVAKTVNQIQAGTNTPEARDLGEAGTEVLAISC